MQNVNFQGLSSSYFAASNRRVYRSAFCVVWCCPSLVLYSTDLTLLSPGHPWSPRPDDAAPSGALRQARWLPPTGSFKWVFSMIFTDKCYKLLKSLHLIGWKQICEWKSLSRQLMKCSLLKKQSSCHVLSCTVQTFTIISLDLVGVITPWSCDLIQSDVLSSYFPIIFTQTWTWNLSYMYLK